MGRAEKTNPAEAGLANFFFFLSLQATAEVFVAAKAIHLVGPR